jgi:transcriptional regulator with XRE-family HTH domain
MSDNNNINGTTLRKAREKEGLSKEDMAEKMGLSPEYITKLERGNLPIPQRMKKWLEELASGKAAAPGAEGEPAAEAAPEPPPRKPRKARARKARPPEPEAAEPAEEEVEAEEEPSAYLLYRQEITYTQAADGAPRIVRSEETDGHQTRVITGVETPNVGGPPEAHCEVCVFNDIKGMPCKVLGCAGNWLTPNGFHFEEVEE